MSLWHGHDIFIVLYKTSQQWIGNLLKPVPCHIMRSSMLDYRHCEGKDSVVRHGVFNMCSLICWNSALKFQLKFFWLHSIFFFAFMSLSIKLQMLQISLEWSNFCLNMSIRKYVKYSVFVLQICWAFQKKEFSFFLFPLQWFKQYRGSVKNGIYSVQNEIYFEKLFIHPAVMYLNFY